MTTDYVVTFDPRPVAGPGAIDGLRRMPLAEARETLRLAAQIPKSGRIVNAATLEIVSWSVDVASLPAVGAQTWDEPPTALSPRGWLQRTMTDGALCLGFYLDYGPEHYRSPHAYCSDRQPCRECQPGNVLACRYWPGERQTSRYFETVAAARAFVDAP